MTLQTYFAQQPLIEKITDVAANTIPTTQLITGILDTPRAALIAGSFALQTSRGLAPKFLVVTDNQLHADQLQTNLSALVDDDYLFNFLSEEAMATEAAISSPESQLSRMQALQALQSDQPAIVLTNAAGMERLLPVPAIFQQASQSYQTNQRYRFAELKQHLTTMGYQRAELVSGPGEFSIRGEIVDIFPMDQSDPIRLDFFDDEIESIKYFDVETQRSIKTIDAVTIYPATDLVMDETTFEKGLTELTHHYQQIRDQAEGADKRKYTDQFEPLLKRLAQDHQSHEILPYLEFFFPDRTNLLDYLPKQGMIFIDDFARLKEVRAKQKEQDAQWQADQIEDYHLLPELNSQNDVVELLTQAHSSRVLFTNLKRGLNGFQFNELYEWQTRPMQQFFGQMPVLKNELERYAQRGDTTVLLLSSQERLESIQKTLLDFGIDTLQPTDTVMANQTQLMINPLSHGFESSEWHLNLITENELFAQVKHHAPRRNKVPNAERLKSYNELKVGDYVVHIHHGIGRYEGLQTIERDGAKQDYLMVAFAKNAKIFVPVTQFNLIQKYISGSDGSPKIDTLGGVDWQKRKHAAAQKVDDIADELIDLYAERQHEKGFAFSTDTPAQLAFEKAFSYQDTPDQIRSTSEIKKDMELAKPMDRLLVGDVGFGKTEVAMRAAFKTLQDHKQVAMLAPTTILTQQHYDTFVSRFAEFDARIGILSRFQTSKQNKATIEALKAHQLDIVVGTHRLLSADVSFADLGLLIIDEEQRFGVKHKEALKRLRSNVDVLTLTATPIPRTLNMAMVGARDLSVLETPPTNRFPIQTYVLEQNWPVVVDAIEKELVRGGQIFYLHNQVNDIERTVGQIQALVPDARVGYIHGQMTEVQLENMLNDFLNNTYDVLVTTTLIETGVDIPNANTLIIENAQNFGLAQLYQLRGRIGRSNRLAYAYFMYPPDKQPNEEAEKRLEAIRDFTELGSGFKLAMRDLSIRGAGDLLGRQQHGFINAVGYELYQQMLTNAVKRKQNQTPARPKTDAEIVLNVEALLPDTYVPDAAQKVEIYQTIRRAQTDEDFQQIAADLNDRFGVMSEPVQQLLLVGQIKHYADLALIKQIKRERQQLVVTLDERTTELLAGEKIFTTLQDLPYSVKVNAVHNALQLTVDIADHSPADYLSHLVTYLKTLLVAEEESL